MGTPRPARTTPEETPRPLHTRMAIAEKELKELKSKVPELEKELWDAKDKMYRALGESRDASMSTRRVISAVAAMGAIVAVNTAATVYMLLRRK